MKLYSNRAGYIIHTQSDYDCYIPKSLNHVEINYDQELISLLSEANNLLGKLDAISSSLPDRDIFISKYVEKEAVVSSQIEGTQASLSDVFQIKKNNSKLRKQTDEIINYVRALNYGIELLDKLPISIRYFKQLHAILLKDVRGNFKNPGEIRRSQNWIGPKGCNISNATFVPPSIDRMRECLYDLELYMNSEATIDPLIKISLIHYQFETIHPFLDGNGRLGRLLIPLWLISNNHLKHPLLYISLYFKQNQIEYYNLLMDVRFKGNYETWIKFFLRAIIEMSKNSIQTINKISELMNKVNSSIKNLKNKNEKTLFATMNYIYKHPYFDSVDLREELELSKPTISTIIKTLTSLQIISPVSEKQRYVTYRFDEYVSILEEGTQI